jgi:pimeloyl-ACP methyl ester carboxylesterase
MNSKVFGSCAVLVAALFSPPLFAYQPGDVIIEWKTLRKLDGKELQYELGTLYVLENRSNPNSRIIGVGFARIRPAQSTGAPPTFHLPGGPGNTILDLLDDPINAQGFVNYLAVGDVVLVEQRGYTSRGDKLLFHYQPSPLPLNQPTSLEAWTQRSIDRASAAVAAYAGTGVDLSGYTVLELADDVNDLRSALGYEKITLVGQSFGSQWAFAIMQRHPTIVERAMLSGVEPLDSAYDMPSDVLAALHRMSWDLDRDPRLQPLLPEDGSGLMGAAREIINRLRTAPISVPVTDPESGQPDTVVLGVGDFQIILGLSGAPEVILAVYNGQYTMWASIIREMRLTGSIRRGDEDKVMPWLVDTSLGATAEREYLLRHDPALEFLGTWVFDLFIPSADIWPSADVGDEFRTPLINYTPVLFINGDWDTNTPIENMLGILPYFPNSRALTVHRGDHGARADVIERTMPDVMQKVFEFLKTGKTTGKKAQLPVRVEAPYPPPPPPIDLKWEATKKK